MLNVQGLSTHIGKIQILHDIDFHVNKGEIVAIIGANGAGKSTLLNTLAGLIQPSAGTVTLEDEVISGFPANKVVGKGLSLVPEGRQVFSNLTVKENLLLGMFSKYYKNKNLAYENLNKMIEMFPNLNKHLHNLGGNLSGGEQQMLAVARGLMSNPKIILLDEPSMGLAPLVVKEILDALVVIKEQLGTMVILVEQNVKAALKVADRAYVIDQGRILLNGTREEISSNPQVMSAYLGVKMA
ncbi:amino acid/amide ABC transporter ATP-binding protein 2, HAAT family [Schinkia azotoformans MEV2011]|uniref:Branched-chain amino acid ABC transporter ATP-binding protein n=2 Tax=Schinkia azotoformans TaxID=1454 RepID=K6DGS2_SCHAZ|nr:ABC transporter ATP-binding protein [Schinkia azotoformans]EKN67298.1 branched-chain amino acid ABC transporter ATP-binding protein [Schinkia azotoformans LMG 9581]KEF40484.1 amino acid/amide ABC transporter ATP-binding protein 2, HAAT family [Schinkia azotoformans MEV2011]MEC1639452.1 ABC transporter ATP-binding protein [Schinkia azotoformans]MEC1696108.1 ABC transporter ATP-binding protein [Schinkia azotoformans]MEC1719597.1 ABC transporter ATP-binding protein [Schinkia azotoformans]